MKSTDWLVFCAALSHVMLYGVWRARGKQTGRSFVVAGRQVPWYAVDLSIMATQASAVTFISTTGQAYVDGMRFLQFYHPAGRWRPLENRGTTTRAGYLEVTTRLPV